MIKVYDNNERKDDKKLRLLNPKLPQPPFRWIIAAPTQAGKSNLIKNILCNQSFGYNKFFDEVYLFAGSLDDVGEYKRLTEEHKLSDKCNVYDRFDNAEVKNLYTSIEQDNLNKPFHTLMIFDDLITDNISNRNKMNIIDSIFIKGRHANISVIIASQIYRAINRNMRILNLSHLTVFHGVNSTDLNAIADEHCGQLTDDDIKQIILNNTTKRYSFITLNYKNEMKDRFLNSNFDIIRYKFDDEITDENIEEEKNDINSKV